MAKQNPTQQANVPRARLTCEQVANLIRDYLNGELTPEVTATFEDHLRRCTDCVAFLKTYQQTVQAVQSLSYEEIPSEMRMRVRQFLRSKMKGFPPSR
jgi:anti-sigma factor RsiW